MGRKTTELFKLLDNMIELLTDAGEEDHWCYHLIKANNHIKDSDFSGITLFLSLFHRDGICDATLSNKIANKQFHAYLSDTYELAYYINRNAEVSTTSPPAPYQELESE